ncbi:hypothetical protein ACF0H5_004799 [Mactra antiquata]
MAENLPYKNALTRYTSKVWQHFGFAKDEEEKVICKLCLKKIKYHGGTTNTNTHLNRHHKNLLVASKMKTGLPVPMAQMPAEASSSTSKDDQKPATASVNTFDLAGRQKIPIKKPIRLQYVLPTTSFKI